MIVWSRPPQNTAHQDVAASTLANFSAIPSVMKIKKNGTTLCYRFVDGGPFAKFRRYSRLYSWRKYIKFLQLLQKYDVVIGNFPRLSVFTKHIRCSKHRIPCLTIGTYSFNQSKFILTSKLFWLTWRIFMLLRMIARDSHYQIITFNLKFHFMNIIT